MKVSTLASRINGSRTNMTMSMAKQKPLAPLVVPKFVRPLGSLCRWSCCSAYLDHVWIICYTRKVGHARTDKPTSQDGRRTSKNQPPTTSKAKREFRNIHARYFVVRSKKRLLQPKSRATTHKASLRVKSYVISPAVT
jgi:hypothetical protein